MKTKGLANRLRHLPASCAWGVVFVCVAFSSYERVHLASTSLLSLAQRAAARYDQVGLEITIKN